MANQPKKYKKFVATAATATLVASAIVPVASAASLSDIAGNTHEAAITSLVDAKIISGYADGTFKPNKTLTRSDVVKLLGKYLVTEGYEVPSDAVSSPRFSDLSSKSNKELLEYAAVVADAGVFAGSNGKLLAGDPITRENMAIVLVRMVNTLKDVSLEEYVDGQDFSKEVKDLNAAKAEARSAINVLDFYDITTATNFLPKNTVTRGQFATFLNNVIKADFAGASATTGTVTAINATTVEVKFGQEIKDISALNFTIEGLEVKNAVVKQSDKTVAVLTTVAQEAGKSYTVKLNGNVVGKFVGISAVIPTAVNITTQSLQAPVGQQVTLKASVTVAEGQSKAGIPVTFNIVNSSVTRDVNGNSVSITTSTLNQPIVVEAKTDENGVATYTYTRYAQTSYQIASHDEVQAYATGYPTARSFGKVYWANLQPLAVTEVTQGNSLTNGAKKVYKVKVALEHAERKADGRYYVNVGFRENVGVTPDKATKTVDVIDSTGKNLGYPGQFTTSTADGNALNAWVKEVEIEVDRNGEAIFTLSGNGATVTPFVFVDQIVNPANAAGSLGRFEATELFTDIPAVTFGKLHTLGLTNAQAGTQYAASFLEDNTGKTSIDDDANHNNEDIANYLDNGYIDALEPKLVDVTASLGTTLKAYKFNNDKTDLLINTGGRDYTATLTDTAGKTAPKDTPVQLQVEIGSSLKAQAGSVYAVDNNAGIIYKLTADASKGGKPVVTLKTDVYGKVSYTLIGHKDAYATPTVFIESGDAGYHDNTGTGAGNSPSHETLKPVLDKNDLQTAGEIVYFSDAVIKDAKFAAVKQDDGSVVFEYESVDQNGKPYRPEVDKVSRYLVTFQVSTTFNTVEVSPRTEYGFVVDPQLGYTGTKVKDPLYQVLNGFYNNNTGTFANASNLATANEYLFNSTPRIIGQDSTGNYGTTFETFTVLTDLDGIASIKVKQLNARGTTVNVTASASEASLPQLKTASHTFTSVGQVTAPHTGLVTKISGSELTFSGMDPILYNQTNAKYSTLVGNTPLTKDEFYQIVNQGNVVVQYTIVDGAATFKIVSVGGSTNVTPGAVALTTAQAKAAALVSSKYTAGSYAAVTSAVATANALLVTATDAQKQAAADAINAAIAALVPASTSTVTVTSATAVGTNMLSSLVGSYTYTVAGTAGTELAGETVTLTFANAAGDLVKDAPTTVTVNADGSFSYTIAGTALFGTFTKVTAKVTKAGTTTTSATKEITVTEAL